MARNVPEKLADDYRRPVDVPERTQLARLSESEQQAWTKAVGFYREKLVQRDVTFDRNLIALRGELGALACANAAARIGDAELWADRGCNYSIQQYGNEVQAWALVQIGSGQGQYSSVQNFTVRTSGREWANTSA